MLTPEKAKQRRLSQSFSSFKHHYDKMRNNIPEKTNMVMRWIAIGAAIEEFSRSMQKYYEESLNER